MKVTRKVSAMKLLLTVEEPADVLALLFGRWLLNGETPKVQLDRMCPSSAQAKKSELLMLLKKQDLIEGYGEKSWQMSDSVLDTARLRLDHPRAMPRAVAETPRHKVAAPLTVSDLVRAYRKALGALHDAGAPHRKQRNMVNFFRHASQMFGPNAVAAALPGFIDWQAGGKRYDLVSLNIYLKTTVPKK